MKALFKDRVEAHWQELEQDWILPNGLPAHGQSGGTRTRKSPSLLVAEPHAVSERPEVLEVRLNHEGPDPFPLRRANAGKFQPEFLTLHPPD